MKTVVAYIAGRFRGATPWEVECNVREAEHVALQVWNASTPERVVSALCVHTMNRHFDGSQPGDTAWLAGVQELVRRSDVVVCVANWKESKGTMAEVALARELGIPVFASWVQTAHPHTHNDILDWGDFLKWLRTQ